MASPVVQVRVPEELLARIDEHRGDVSRSAWILAACEAALNPAWNLGGLKITTPILPVPADPPEPVKRQRTQKPPAVIAVPPGQSMGGRPEPVRRRRCTHPGTRVIGGYCKSCDVVVLSGGYLPD